MAGLKDNSVEENLYRGEKPFATLLHLFRGERISMLIAFVLFSIKHSPTWVIPLITANIIDILVDHKSSFDLFINIAILLGVTLQNWPLNVLYVRFQSTAIREVESNLRTSLVERLQELSMSFYAKTNPGVLQSKIIRDVENIEQLVRNATDGGFAAINGIVGAIVVTAIRVPSFLPFFIILGPALSFLIYLVRKKLAVRNSDFRNEVETMSGRVNVMTTLLPITRAHGLESTAIAEISQSFSLVKQVGLKLDIFNGIFNALAWVTFQMANVLCLSIAAYCALKKIGGVTTGDVVLLTSFFGQLIGSLILLTNLAPQITKGLASIASLGELLESSEIEKNTHKPPMVLTHGEVQFKSINFTYPQAAVPALDSINFVAHPHTMIALVGASGSGKSTLINLLVGMLTPQQGEITIDGQILHDYDLRTYRRSISVVPQETILFDGSIAANVGYGLRNVSEHEIQKALVAANAWEFVSQLPDGMQTLVGERGARLSGGQKQRLSIARALIRNPKILILDEATSSLDSNSEKLIQAAMEDAARSRTTFVIAHRLSTIIKADEILVLERGKIVEHGSHDQLVSLGGVYSTLLASQSLNGDFNIGS